MTAHLLISAINKHRETLLEGRFTLSRPLGREYEHQVCVMLKEDTYKAIRDKVSEQQVPLGQYIRSLVLKDLRKEEVA